MTALTTPRPDLYLCTRTSVMWDERPCEEAFQITIRNVDTRTVDSPDKLTWRKEDWYKRGTNHRVVGGRIKRDLDPQTVWAVIVTDLPAFVRKYGNCVVRENAEGFMEIEIYDSYRE